MLFLHDLERREILGVAAAQACPRVEVLLVAFVVLEQTLVDSILTGIRPVAGNIQGFIHAVGTHSLGFLPEA